MNSIVYDPVNPAPYLNYVSVVEQRKNNILIIITGIIIIGGMCYLVYYNYKKTYRTEKESLQKV